VSASTGSTKRRPEILEGVAFYGKYVRVLQLNQTCRGRNISNQAARNHLQADFAGNSKIELNA